MAQNTHTHRVLPRLIKVAALTAGLTAAAPAWALPSISIVSPAPGTPLHNPRPTITVAYARDADPLNLETLRIVVNGVDWTGRFTADAGSASYTVSEADTLVAGRLTIEAFIQDEANGSANAEQTYDLFPLHSALQPATGNEGDEITVVGLGLDSDAARNALLFTSVFGTGTEEVAFSSVDRELGRGTVVVPAGAATGPTFLKVNGNRSRDARTFTVVSLPACGGVLKAEYLSDGGMLVHYAHYDGRRDPRCPTNIPPCGTDIFPQVVLRIFANGSTTVVETQSCFPLTTARSIRAIAVDKPRTRHAVFTTSHLTGVHSVRYGSRTTVVDGLPLPGGVPFLGAAFDREGNLYVLIAVTQLELYSISGEALNAGGATTASLVWSFASEPGLFSDSFLEPLVVGCDNRAYVVSNDRRRRETRLLRVRLADGELEAMSLPTPGEINSLIASCHSDELWALGRDGGFRTQLSKFELEEAPPAINPPQLHASLATLAYSIALRQNGRIELNTLTGNVGIGQVEACTISGGALNALPLCQNTEPGIAILPSTTRWKAQRSDDPIVVDFSGPDDLDLNGGVLEITSPAGPLITFNGPITVTSPTGPFTYRIQWTGPRTYTDPSDGQVKRLPAANYTVVVKATPQGGNQLRSAPYDKVSLVEVQQMRLEEATGLELQGNPGTGGGKRIMAEATQASGSSIADKVKAIATIFPPIPDAPPDNPVRVYFRSYDVDDPSTSTLPVDDESQPADNCLEARSGPPVNCPLADDGLLYDPHTDPDAGSAINGRVGIAVRAAADRAVAGLRVSMLQGSNYRLAASTFNPWLDGLRVKQRSGTGELRHSHENVTGSGQLSEMLTVWRTLHLELGWMDARTTSQQAIQVDGTYTRRLQRSKLTDRNADFRNTTTPDGTLDHPRNNDWKGSDVNPNASAGADFLVKRNNRTTLTIDSGDLRSVPADPLQPYYLRDDKLDRLTSASHQTGVFRDILREGYIEVEERPSTTPWSFVRNLDEVAHDALRSVVPNSANYWNVPLVLSFEFELTDDHDPTDEAATSGRCSPNAQPVAVAFQEMIEDFQTTNRGCFRSTVSLADYMAGTHAHEALHAMTLGHDGNQTGAIMCATLKNDAREANRHKITLAQLLRLRKAVQPNGQLARQVSDTCPIRPTCP